MGQPSYTQVHFQFQDNGADANTSSLIGTEDNTLTSFNLDTVYFLRFKLTNTGAKTQDANFRLEVDVGGGGYNQVTNASTYVRYADGGDTDGDAISTERLTDTGNTWVNGEYSEDGEVTAFSLAHSPSEETELVYAITFRSADLSGGETVTFRLSDAGITSNMVYTVEPDATVPAQPKTASGSPETHTTGGVPLTSTGNAVIPKTASGTPDIAAVTGAGILGEVFVNDAASYDAGAVRQPVTSWSDTSITLGDLTQGALGTGTMYVAVHTDEWSNWYEWTASAGGTKTASGTPSIAIPTSSGSATKYDLWTASGSPSIGAVTADGSAERTLGGSGTPSIAAATADGSAKAFTVITASGAPSTPAVTATGLAERVLVATGAVAMAACTATGTAERTAGASGSPSIAAVTASGAAERAIDGSGTPSISIPTATGSASFLWDASGAPVIALVESSGNATKGATKTASGSPDAPVPTADGSATIYDLWTASGSPSIGLLTASGAAERVSAGSGTPSIGAITATGQASFLWSASGTPAIPLLTADGTATKAGEKTASGSPSIGAVTADGSATIYDFWTASGSPSIAAITADGSSDRVSAGSGSPSITLPTSTGSASKGGATLTASGTPSIAAVTASGQVGDLVVWVNDTQSLTGAVRQTVTDRRDTALTLGSLSRGSLGTGTMYVAVERTGYDLSNYWAFTASWPAGSGAVATPVPTSSGSATVPAQTRTASGSPGIAAVTGDGAVLAGTNQVWINSTDSKDGNEVSQPIQVWGDQEITLGALAQGGLADNGDFYVATEGENGLSNWYAFSIAIPGSGTATIPGGYTSAGSATIGDLPTKTIYATGTGATVESQEADIVGPGVAECDGTPEIGSPTSSGNAKAFSIVTSSGASGIGAVIASGAATKGAATVRTASGAASSAVLTASGSAERIRRAYTVGPIEVPAATSTGTVNRSYQVSGSPSIAAVTAQGAVGFWSAGSPLIAALQAAGAAERIVTGSGSPSIGLATADGNAETWSQVGAYGASAVSAPSSAGTAKHVIPASGSADAVVPTADGIGLKTPDGTGTIQSSLAAVAGTGDLNEAGELYGEGDLASQSAEIASAGKVTRYASGAVQIPLPTAYGNPELDRAFDPPSNRKLYPLESDRTHEIGREDVLTVNVSDRVLKV